VAGGHGLRKVGERAAVDRKTARRHVAAAEAAGLTREAGVEAVADELVGLVVDAVRPARPNGHAASWELLLAHEGQIRAWVGGGVSAKPVVPLRTEASLGGRDARALRIIIHRQTRWLSRALAHVD
jgi:hypothetical protein